MRAYLFIPHAEWVPARVATLADVWHTLHGHTGFATLDINVNANRCHWSEWALGGWREAIASQADVFVTIQDDVEVAHNFWPSLSAMFEAWPQDDVISLAATHSLGPEVARQGRRSYRTGRITGWGWAMRMPLLRELVAWCDAGNLDKFRERMPSDGEDTLVTLFLAERRIVPRNPVPTIVDHLFLPSTNPGFDNHTHRRSTVTWRGYVPEDMATPSWWQTTCSLLPGDHWRMCSFCLARPVDAESPVTAIGICRMCIGSMALGLMGITVDRKVEP